MNYGLLEEFVTTVLETVPDLMSYRERVQLVMGLRARLILELCQSNNLADLDTIEPHLVRIRTSMASHGDEEISDPEVEECEQRFMQLIQIILEDQDEKNDFFQKVFPECFGPEYDSELQTLVWEFLSRLEQLLSTQTFEQAASWLSSASSDLEECMHFVSRPQPLKTLLKYNRDQKHLIINDNQSYMGDWILTSLSNCLSKRKEEYTDIKVSDCESELVFESGDCPHLPLSGEDETVIETVIEQGNIKLHQMNLPSFQPRVLLHRLDENNWPSLKPELGRQQKYLNKKLQTDCSHDLSAEQVADEQSVVRETSLKLLTNISEESYNQDVTCSVGKKSGISPKSGRTPFTVHVCSYCPFFHVEPAKMFHHIKTFHPYRQNCDSTLSMKEGNVSPKSEGQESEISNSNHDQFQCPVCKKTLYSKDGIARHSRLHSGKIKCYLCLKPFSSQHDLWRHMQRKFDCRKKLHKSDLQSDIEGKPGQNTQLEKSCQITEDCSEMTSFDFVEGRSVSPEEEGYDWEWEPLNFGAGKLKCPVCQKNMRTKATLKRHQNVHSGKYKCRRCLKAFSTKRDLRRHMVRKTGCGTKVQTKRQPGMENKPGPNAQLEKNGQITEMTLRGSKAEKSVSSDHEGHEPLNSGTFQYECPVCKKHLLSKATLMRHHNFHSGKYKCRRCCKAFSAKRDLWRHMERKTDCEKKVLNAEPQGSQNISLSDYGAVWFSQRTNGTSAFVAGQNGTMNTLLPSSSENQEPEHLVTLTPEDSDWNTQQVPET